MMFITLLIYFAIADEPIYCPVRSAIPQATNQKLNEIRLKVNAVKSKELRPSAQAPAWLNHHVGLGTDQIAPVVLERARKSHLESKSKNPCYIAMDATIAHAKSSEQADGMGAVNNRAYLICEDQKIFFPFSSGHGSGAKIDGLKLANPRECASNFGNAMGSNLTAGGRFMTGKAHNIYKGELGAHDGMHKPYCRWFMDFEGVGENSNARERDLGLHPAVIGKKGCYKADNLPGKDKLGHRYYFNEWNYYYDGRSNGCISTTDDVSHTIMSIAENKPMSVYIYPEKKDIEAMKFPDSKTYWNKECLDKIKSEKLEPQYFDRSFDAQIKAAKEKVSKIKPPSPRKMCEDSKTIGPAVEPTRPENTVIVQ